MIKIGNTVIHGWKSKLKPTLGLNLEFSRNRPTWLIFPFGVICIRKHKLPRNYETQEYIPDQQIDRGKIGKLRIIEHIEPMGNKNFFNLGISGRALLIGRYWII